MQLSDSLRPAPRRWKTDFGVGGELAEIYQILHACLQIGQLDRASATVRRLGLILLPDAPELLAAHNAYLGALVAKIVVTKDERLIREVHRWFHVDMLAARYPEGVHVTPRMKRGVQPNALTIALIVQASLHGRDEKQIARSVRRYLGHARRLNIYDDARIAILSQLSDDDAKRLARYDSESFTDLQEYTGDYLSNGEEFGGTMAPSQPAINVRSQAQKGLGLVSLQKSLSALSEEAVEIEDESLASRQERLERSVITSALERWRLEHEEMERRVATNNSLQSKPVGALLWTWHEALLPLVKEELNRINAHLRKVNNTRRRQGASQHASKKQRYLEADRSIYGPFMRFISPEKLSAVTILTCIQQMVHGFKERQFTPSTYIIKSVGRAIEDESHAESISLQKACGLSRKLPTGERIKRLSRLVRRNRRGSMGQAAKESLAKLKDQSTAFSKDDDSWTQSIVVKLGAVLVSKLLQAAKVDVRQERSDGTQIFKHESAFSWGTQYLNGNKLGVVSMHPTVIQKFQKEPVGSAIAKHLPMIVKPMPWTGFTEGGFLHQHISVVRAFPEYRQTRDYLKVASNSGDMSQIFAGLDVLGRTKWQVNRRVFDVMLQVWNSGEAVASIPPADPKLNYPPPPRQGADKTTWKQYNAQVKRLDDIKDGMHSNRCFNNFQMEVAKAFLNETFYLPHNLDFRGRAYPIPPYFSHMGADNCRGLMLFGEGRPLGPGGLRWLQIHLANVCGFDKASLADRQQWTLDRMEEVWDSARNPLSGRRWWLKADDPWQCLATCFEITSALSSPDPAEYVSCLPVHQDGTCNGLQHYAALGGDEFGARQVNLEPGPRPSDIYSAVSQMISEQVAEEAANDIPMARKLDGKIVRKVVKQTVMTNVYGVTMAGAREQVRKQLEDLYPDLFPDDPKAYIGASIYVAKKIFWALGRMFNGANAIQTWLGQCGSRISTALTAEQIQTLADRAANIEPTNYYRLRPTNSKTIADEFSRFRSTIIWTTPLKMPVVQPYRKSAVRRVATNLSQVSLVEPSVADPVDKRKQLQGFAPNFIHSLDATHMMLSALRCAERGLTFAAVHDSFWTHAADVPVMNDVIRDAFVRMHAEDIMGRLAAEFAARYKGAMYLAAVPRATPLGQRILTHRGANRKRMGTTSETERQIVELLDENRRLQLLRSEDPEEQEKGRQMRTAGWLWATADKEKDLVMPTRGQRAAMEASSATDATPAIVEDAVSESPSLDASTTEHSDAEAEEAEAVEESVDGSLKHTTEVAPAENPAFPFWAPHGLTKAGKAKRIRKPLVKTVWVWLPLEFPPIPEKVRYRWTVVCFASRLTLAHRATSTSRGSETAHTSFRDLCRKVLYLSFELTHKSLYEKSASDGVGRWHESERVTRISSVP